MKKLVLMFASVLSIISCSSNEDSLSTPAEPVVVLLKKLIQTENGVETITNFNYDGNKLISRIEVGGYKEFYTYTGDFITKIELNRPDGTIQSRYEYTYTNGKNTKLITTRWSNGNIFTKYKNIYTVLSNGNISYTQKGVDFSGVEPLGDSDGATIGVYTFSNGMCVSRSYDFNNITQNYTFQYDTKTNPLVNVLNLKKLVNFQELYSVNSPLKITRVEGFSDPNFNNTRTNTFTYTYNSNNYPITGTDIFTKVNPNSPGLNSTTMTTLKYFYE